jgi:hypothetical protein
MEITKTKEIKYNNDGTFNIKAMSREQKDNYLRAVDDFKSSSRFNSEREQMEEYISEDVINGLSTMADYK